MNYTKWGAILGCFVIWGDLILNTDRYGEASVPVDWAVMAMLACLTIGLGWWVDVLEKKEIKSLKGHIWLVSRTPSLWQAKPEEMVDWEAMGKALAAVDWEEEAR